MPAIPWTILPNIEQRRIERGYSRYDILGELEGWINDSDPRPAYQQINHHYSHGGGWHEFKDKWRVLPGFARDDIGRIPIIQYPGDPPYRPVAFIRLREELIVLYPHAIVAVFDKQGETLNNLARID